MKKIIRFFTAVIVLPLFACTSGLPPLPPDAQTMEEFLNFFTGAYETEADLFFGLTDCASAQAAIEPVIGIPNIVSCPEGGSQAGTITQFSCEDGPPLAISITINNVFSICMIGEGLTLNGTNTGNEGRDGSSFTLLDTANGLQVEDTAQGDNFTFDVDILFEVTQGSSGTCSGTITVNEQTCEVSADCKTCPFP